MIDIKEVITTLCKYLNVTIGSALMPDNFRLAKYDRDSDDIVSTACKSVSKTWRL
jgi:hypothetical protein